MKYSKKNKYIVKDSCGQIIRVFNNYQQAIAYKNTFGNSSWYITY